MLTVSKKTSALKDMSSSQLVDLYNSLVSKDKQIKKFRDRETALRRIEQLQPQQQKTEKENKMSNVSLLRPKETQAKQPKEKKAKKSDRIIKLLTKENPRRAGTAGWHHYNLYKDGMTVAELKSLGGLSNHLNWDIKHGYISVEQN